MNHIQFNSGAIDGSGCVSDGWELVKRNYGLFFGVSLVGMILAGCIPCVSLFLVGPIMGGLYYIFLRDMRGEPVDFGMLFKGFDKFVPLMVIGIVQSIPEIIGQILRITVDVGRIGLEGATGRGDFYQSPSDTFPIALASGMLVIIVIVAVILILAGIVWRALLFFAIPLAIEHDLGAVDAMKLSARAAMSNVGGLIVLFIFEFLVALLGVIMLCVGILFVMPIIYAANAFAYRQVFPRLFDEQFRNVPPPPDVYGGSFGRGQ